MSDDRDEHKTKVPPFKVAAQIAPPLKKPRPLTPVPGVNIVEAVPRGEFEREITNVTPIPRHHETSLQRMERHGAENKNELARLRDQQDQMFAHLMANAAAWRNFWMKVGALILLAAGVALGVVKLSGCG